MPSEFLGVEGAQGNARQEMVGLRLQSASQAEPDPAHSGLQKACFGLGAQHSVQSAGDDHKMLVLETGLLLTGNLMRMDSLREARTLPNSN